MRTRIKMIVILVGVFFSLNLHADPDSEKICKNDITSKENIYAKDICVKETCGRESLVYGATRVDCRIKKEAHTIGEKNSLIPHKQNYILFYAYEERPNQASWTGYEGDPDKVEVIFQISIKYPVWIEKDQSPGRFSAFIGYTQKSFWQLYNKRNSAPFRESNYEPELLINYIPEWEYKGFELPLMTLGINHQSNGQSEPKSRSWNRIYLKTVFAKGNFALSLRPWYRLPESKESDDNRHILDYMGRGDIVLAYSRPLFQASMLLRNNLEFDKDKENRGAVQVDFGWPIPNTWFKLYVQYFHGYGESLIDYNYSSNRFGVGILTTDWL